MVQRISASVGRSGGVNRSPDVKIVQGLLNNVPFTSSGPNPKLRLDGLCGPKTSDAIHKFQLRHFGMSGADGRVDPAGRTLAKLNEFDATASPFPRLTMSSALRCPHGGTVSVALSKSAPIGSINAGLPLSPSDTFVVAGCRFFTPCSYVRWFPSPYDMLDSRSMGVCVNGAGIPQGPVLIVKP